MLSSRGASTRAHRGRWWSRNFPPLRGSRNPAMHRCPTLNTHAPFHVACASDGVKQKTSEGITRPLCQEQVHSARIHLHSVRPKPDPASALCPERPHWSLRSCLVLFWNDAFARREGTLERSPVLSCLLQLGSQDVRCYHHSSCGFVR